MIKLSAAGSGSFSPTVQLEKREMHMVFLHFSSFYLDQNLSLAALADRISSYTGSGILHKAESDLRSLSSIPGPFIQHNVQNDAVHHRGSVIPQADKIRYCLCCILLHDPFIRLYADASHGHGGADEGRIDTGRHLQGVIRLRTIAKHTGNAADHVIHSTLQLHTSAAHQVYQAARHACSGYRSAA